MVKLTLLPINKILPYLNEEEFLLVQSISRKGCLKATQPNIEYEYIHGTIVPIKRPTDFSGKVAYLWCAVAYELSPYKRDLAAPPDYHRYLTSRETADRLSAIAQLICDNVPKEFHYGLIARGVL